MKYIFVLVELKHTEFLLLKEVICLTATFLKVPSVGFSVTGLDRAKFGFYHFQSFLFIVVIVISILLKPTFWPILIDRQSLVKILSRSDKDKITFKAVKNVGMASEKLYRNTLNSKLYIVWNNYNLLLSVSLVITIIIIIIMETLLITKLTIKTYLQLISLKKKRKLFSQSTIYKSFHKSPVHFN